jgi:hypothetical protein
MRDKAGKRCLPLAGDEKAITPLKVLSFQKLLTIHRDPLPSHVCEEDQREPYMPWKRILWAGAESSRSARE